MKRRVYLNAVYRTGLGYHIECTAGGRIYARCDGHLRRLDALPTRVGLAISGPDEERFTLRRDLTLVVHGDPDREIRPVGEKKDKETEA